MAQPVTMAQDILQLFCFLAMVMLFQASGYFLFTERVLAGVVLQILGLFLHFYLYRS